MTRRPVIERRRADEAELQRHRRARVLLEREVSAALAGIEAGVRDKRLLGAVLIRRGYSIVAKATDGAGAQSALGVAARHAEPFCAPGPDRTAAEAVFAGGRR